MTKAKGHKPEHPTKQKVREMTESGLKPRQISAALGISTQAVYQHLNSLKDPATN